VTHGSEDDGSEPRSVETGGSPDEPPVGPVPCVQALLDAICTDGDVETHLAALAAYDDDALVPLREGRRPALAFWLNLYNAGTQLLLDRRPALYESPLRTVRFFRAEAVTVAGTPLSLNDIEHGIVRGSKSMLGLGYLPRFRPSGFERRYRLESIDPRTHFALNCGAASCPAIRFYEPAGVDDRLDLATALYLDDTVSYDAKTGVARVPRVCLWFRGDFGGGDGIRDFLRTHEAIPADAEPKISYRSWDWSRADGKFAE